MKKILAASLLTGALFASCWLISCHSFSTLKGSSAAPNGAGQVSIDSNRMSGLVYYLPRGRIRITGDFKSPGGGGGDSAGAKSGPPAGARLFAGAPSGLPGGDAAEQKNFVVTIAADIEADPSQRYYLKPVRNYFYDDDIHLAVNAKHLLSTGNATAEDQTAKIISTTASLAAQAAGVPTGGGPEAFAEPLLSEITVGELLHQIEEAVSDKKVSLDTKIKASKSDLDKLKGALPNLDSLSGFPAEKKQKVDVTLAYLSVKEDHSFTPRNIWDLLWLLVPEASSEKIKPQNAPELFRKLYAELNPESGSKPPEYKPARPFSIVFDPEHAEPDDLRAYGFIVTVKKESQPEIKLLKEIWEGENKNVAHGIAFRAVKPYRVEIKSVDKTWFYVRESRLVLLPDTSAEHTLVLDYSRLAFVKKTTNVTFVDGIPQDLAQTAPSSALGFLAIPKGIIQAMVPLSPGITGRPGGVQGPGTSGTTGAPPSPAPSPSPTS